MALRNDEPLHEDDDQYDGEIDLEHPDGASEAEFAAWRWEPVKNIPKLIVPFKRAVYERVVAEFAKFAAAPK